MNRTTTFALSAATLLALTGTTMSAAAAQARAAYHDQKTVNTDRDRDNGMNRADRAMGYEFHRGSELIGTDVVNPNGDTIADVEDFIIDRGDGRITHVLLKSGDVLGIGGKTIAVPYERLSYNLADKEFRLDMTEEQIDRAAEFVPENWADLQHVTWTERMDNWFNGDDDDRADAAVDDEYSAAIREGDSHDIDGTIMNVNRSRSASGWEEVTLTVSDEDGKTHELVLGPSWYVMSQDAAPMRGQKIEAEAVPLARDGRNREVVLSAEINDKDLQLRTDEGRARWNVSSEERRSQAEQGRGRLVLASDVIGADVRARGGEDAGDVNDLLVERRSGQVAAICLDPDDNFLGIGDDIKLVPWTLASVTPKGAVRIDADKGMIKGGQTLPEDVSVYNTSARLEPVYASYGINVYKFEPREDHGRRDADKDMRGVQDARTGAWSQDSRLIKQFRDGQKASFTGKIKSVQTDTIGGGTPDARVVVVSTDQGDRNVVIGPSWYIDRQNLRLREGDRVTVTGKKAVIDGREYVAAWTLQCPDKTLTLWEGDNAAWNSGR